MRTRETMHILTYVHTYCNTQKELKTERKGRGKEAQEAQRRTCMYICTYAHTVATSYPQSNIKTEWKGGKEAEEKHICI